MNLYGETEEIILRDLIPSPNMLACFTHSIVPLYKPKTILLYCAVLRVLI